MHEDETMHKALKNFAYAGNTYFVGDVVPQDVATAMDASYTEKSSTKKTTTKDTLEGE